MTSVMIGHRQIGLAAIQWVIRSWLVAGLLISVVIYPACGQNVALTERPRYPASTVVDGSQLPEDHLAGDWEGWRPILLDHGVDLRLSYASQTAGVVSGGERSGVDYAHSIVFQINVDWAKMAGLTGFSTHLAGAERAGRNTSSDYIGDNLTDVQQLYGLGGDVAVRLAYLYAEQILMDNVLDLAVGRFDIGQDFAVSPLNCEFQSLSICPSPRSLTIQNSLTFFLASTWGGRARVQPRPDVYLQAGIYQVRPSYGGRAGVDWTISDSTGLLFPVELCYQPNFGFDRRVGHYKVGMTYDTSRYPALSASSVGTVDDTRHGGPTFYVFADQMVRRTGPDQTDGVILLAGYTHADPRVTVIEQLVFGGILATGVIPGRRHDTIGFQTTWFKVSKLLTATQELQSALGQPLMSGLGGVAAPLGIQGHEVNLEAVYNIYLTKGIYIEPEIQYIVQPNATRHYSNATILALQTTVDF